MEHPNSMSSEQASNKRPRSPTGDPPLPAAKVPRTSGQLQINYLVRQNKEIIPLVTVKEQLPELLRLVGEYDGVLQRHESMAGNLGACPLGPILLKRFERLFDGPPRILKSHARDANVSWLDVVEFAQNKPEQFNLEKMRNGIRVCQFYTKQCRVEISEEDFVLIASGMPQKLIPPQPILEDEEKELGVMDLLDRNLGQVIQLADQVSARARQLIHKMKNRRAAILARREAEAEARRTTLRSNDSPMSPAEPNGKPLNSIEQPQPQPQPQPQSQSPPMGFTAVNNRQSMGGEPERRPLEPLKTTAASPEEFFPASNTGTVTYINGRSIKGASPTERAEMMKSFMSASERENAANLEHARRASMGAPRQVPPPAPATETRPRSDSLEMMASNALKQNISTVAIPNTPASLMPQLKTIIPERDDGGPWKIEMVGRMESMQRGERIIPPCDRCRRLHMDCLKNLTACMGCTKKHAKCSWKDVREEELEELKKLDAEKKPEGQHQSRPASPFDAPVTVAEITRAVEESRPSDTAAVISAVATEVRTPTTGPNVVNDPPAPGPAKSPIQRPEAPPPTAAAPLPKPEAAERAPSTPRFDVRPPPLVQGPLHENRRSPPQAHHPSFVPSYAPKEPVRHVEDENDEGDRLEALARSTYRSYSQSVRSPEH